MHLPCDLLIVLAHFFAPNYKAFAAILHAAEIGIASNTSWCRVWDIQRWETHLTIQKFSITMTTCDMFQVGPDRLSSPSWVSFLCAGKEQFVSRKQTLCAVRS